LRPLQQQFVRVGRSQDGGINGKIIAKKSLRKQQ
jgi:hypothetical protein